MRRERVRLTPLAGSARKALPILLAAALLAAPGTAEANSGGQPSSWWDDLYYGSGGLNQAEAIGGNITIDEPDWDAAGGLILSSSSANDVTLSNNTVTVLDGASGYGIYGATIGSNVTGTVTMEGNRVFVKGGDYNTAAGALASILTVYQNTPILKDNHVVIDGGSFKWGIDPISGAGGRVEAQSDASTVTGNSLTINAGTFGPDVFGGGYSFFGGWLANSGDTAVNGNSVTIKGGTFSSGSIISGGFVFIEAPTGHFTVNNNVVDLGNVTLDNAQIVGGALEDADPASNITGSATGNKVILREGLTLTGNSTLHGGYNMTSNPNLDVRTGNTLEVRTFGLTATNVYNFENYHFILPGSIKAGNTVLTLTDKAGTDISGARVGVAVAGGSAPLAVGDSVTLLKNDNGLISEGYTQTTLTGTQGVSLAYDFTLAATDTALTATVGTISEEPGGDDEPGGGDEPGGSETPGGGSAVRVLPQTKALAEGYLAGSLLVRQGGDLIADRGMAHALRAARGTGEYTFAPFGTISGGWSRYDTGSHIDVSSLNLLVGLAKGVDLAPGRFTAGLFFEYGNGSYDTWNSFSNAATVKGDGDAWYAGGGLLARMDFAETGPGHFYAEASARLGVLNNDYDNDDMRDAFGRRASYDSDSAYYGLHVGAGYVWNLSDKADLDLYARYLWTHQDSDSLSLSTGERLHFDSVDSHRLRLGARFAYTANEYVRPYIGAAWEHEFDGEARATTNGFDIDRPDLKGSTGIGELGITLTPSSSIPVSLDLGVQGYVGKREGVSGTIQLQWKF